MSLSAPPPVPTMENSVGAMPLAAIHPPKARKRARPASSKPYSITKSKGAGHAAQRGKAVAGLPLRSMEYRDIGHPSKVMTPVSNAAVLLTAVPSAAVQETVYINGHRDICEPANVPAQPNFTCLETGRAAIPNSGLQPIDYISHSTSFDPLLNPEFTSVIQEGSQPWVSSAFYFPYPIFAMHPYPGYSPYDQDIPAHEIDPHYQQQYALPSEESFQQFLPQGPVTSPPYPDHVNPPYMVSPDNAGYDFGGFPDFQAPIMTDSDWSDVGNELSSESTGGSSPGEQIPSADPNPSHTNDHAGAYCSWQVVPDPTVITHEVDNHTLSVTHIRQAPRSSRDRVRKNIGGRKAGLTQEQRNQASVTRQLVACLRCQFQRASCKPNPDNPDGPCLTCLKIQEVDSKKVIHRWPCLRSKLTSVTTFRSGGLNFTRRPGWEGAAMKDLGPNDWASDSICTINLTLGYCSDPIILKVRKFKPVEGDVLARTWTHDGVTHETLIEPYALADIQKTKSTLLRHIEHNAFDAVMRYAENDRVHPLVQETYKAAWSHMCSVDYTTAGDISAQSLMKDVFKLWFATKNTLGSAWLKGEPGTEATLGMIPDPRPGYPFPGKVSAPRLVCQQFDAINYNVMLHPWRNSLLNKLWKLMSGKDPKNFYTIYLVVFILLHEVSCTSKDRYWHAANNDKIILRYNMEYFMEELQEGANTILGCWHYYRRGFNPLDADWEKIQEPDKREKLFRDITPDQVKLMKRLAHISSLGEVPMTKTEQEGWPGLIFDKGKPNPLIWERDLHFISQMFDDKWKAGPTWSRAWDYGQPLEEKFEFL